MRFIEIFKFDRKGTTITFTNWGHPNGSMPGWTFPGIATELVLDDVIVNVIPEPSALTLVGFGTLAMFHYDVRRRRAAVKELPRYFLATTEEFFG